MGEASGSPWTITLRARRLRRAGCQDAVGSTGSPVGSKAGEALAVSACAEVRKPWDSASPVCSARFAPKKCLSAGSPMSVLSVICSGSHRSRPRSSSPSQ